MPTKDVTKFLKKRVSSAVFYTDKKLFLAVHPTRKNFWEIPKGEIDAGETPEATAIREFKEETGITIYKNELQYMGYCSLHESKDLYLFAYVVDKLPNISSIVCKSTTTAYGKPVPEIDDFMYLPIGKIHELRIGLRVPLHRAVFKLFDLPT